LLNDGREAATARARQLALRRFAAWLAEEGELDADPLAGLKPPKLDSKVVPVLSDQQLRAVLAACQGPALIPAHHPRTARTPQPPRARAR
jgi:integrase/recombinase XerD